MQLMTAALNAHMHEVPSMLNALIAAHIEHEY